MKNLTQPPNGTSTNNDSWGAIWNSKNRSTLTRMWLFALVALLSGETWAAYYYPLQLDAPNYYRT